MHSKYIFCSTALVGLEGTAGGHVCVQVFVEEGRERGREGKGKGNRKGRRKRGDEDEGEREEEKKGNGRGRRREKEGFWCSEGGCAECWQLFLEGQLVSRP